ncbi:MAG TPA: DUF4261 domain-containing protein [Actinomycetes bacterium]|nr:DUF4261 domain-containing protein [Actinomycetes bacterium]
MSNPPGVYAVELLYDQQPEFDAARLLGALRSRLGGVEPIEGMDSSLGFAISELYAHFADVRTNAQLVITPTDVSYNPELAANSLQQTWDWPGAADAVAGCTRGVFVSDFLARTLPPAVRLRFMVEAVRTVAEIAPPLAIDWKPAQKVVDPRTGLTAPTLPFNVRFFTLADSDENVMDTRGLDILGLPDVQCRFTGLSPAEVASHLYGIAAHLVQQGPVRDGFVAAATDGHRWVCRYGESLAGPARQVVDLQQDKDVVARSGQGQPSGGPASPAQSGGPPAAAPAQSGGSGAAPAQSGGGPAAPGRPGGPATPGQATGTPAPAHSGSQGAGSAHSGSRAAAPGRPASGSTTRPATPGPESAAQVPAQDPGQVRSRQG